MKTQWRRRELNEWKFLSLSLSKIPPIPREFSELNLGIRDLMNLDLEVESKL